MNKLCENINKFMSEQFICSDFNGFTKVRTPYLYPDGDVIDIFVKYKDSGFILTDLGETIGWLLSRSISNSLSEKKNELINHLTLMYQVERYKGMLIKRCNNSENLSTSVLDLCQAIIRVSDIYLTFKGNTKNSFDKDVANFLSQQELEFTQNIKYIGKSERERTIEFQVKRKQNISLIKGFNYKYKTKAEANNRADIIYSCWADLEYLKIENPNIFFISLINDSHGKIPYPQNINLLQENSRIAYWSQKNTFKNILNGQIVPQNIIS